MEGFLQHVRSLRMQISEYEDKAAEISARKQQEQTEILSIKQDLDRITRDIKECSRTTEKLSSESGVIGRAILMAQQEQQQADLDITSLDQAIVLMKTSLEADAIRQRSREQELDSAYDDMSKQMDEYKNYYMSRNLAGLIREIDLETKELISKLSETDCTGIKGSADAPDKIEDQLKKARSDQDQAREAKASVEKEMQEVQDDIKNIQEQMKEINGDILKVMGQIDVLPDHVKAFANDDQTAALHEELEGVAEDKLQEKRYAADCRQRLEVLQADQMLDCPSCGHHYEVKALQKLQPAAALAANDEQTSTPMED